MLDSQDWIVCPKCKSEDAGLIDWRPDNETTLKCPECGLRTEAAYSGDEFAKKIYG